MAVRVAAPGAVPVREYLAKRQLGRYAGVWSLWALGVSAVIPGEFSGWSYGLITGGFGGMLVATLVVIVMYLGLCFSLAELSTAMPFAGGAYAYGRTAFGPWGGYLAGVAQNAEYVLTAAAVVVSVGDSLDAVVFELARVHIPEPLIWLAAYLVFTAINIYGMRLTCQVALLLTVFSLGVLGYFGVATVPHFDLALALDVPAAPGGSPWLPNGMLGIAWSVPFAIWFLVIIEMVTLTAEETDRPHLALPRGLLYGIATLIVAALLVLFLNSAVPPGAKAVGNSTEPLLLALDRALEDRVPDWILALLALSSYVAGFHATIYAYGRSIFAFSRAGCVHPALSLTHPKRKTPYVALIAGGLIGYAAALLIKLAFPALHADAVLLHMAVLAAVLSYIIQMLSFLALRRNRGHMARPFVSPLGATGAMTTLVIAVLGAALMFFDPQYRAGLIGLAVIFGIAILRFILIPARHVEAAPEEEFAREHGR